VPHSFSYVWRYGAQCRGVDGRPGESCYWPSVMARLYPSRSGFEGGRVETSRLLASRTLTRGCG
jgi:hypothetical protein